MKQTLSMLCVIMLLLVTLVLPHGFAGADAVGTESTTTSPSVTTTTDWDCHSTNTTFPPTTTTTLNLTGPDGINPDYTTTATTASEENDCVGIDLLTTANVGTGDTVSVLAGPYADLGFCADCYSYDGGVIAIVPSNGGAWDLSVYRYLHLTVNSNMPFTVMLMDHSNAVNSGTSLWFGETMNSEDSMIAKGKYVAVIDLYERYAAYLGSAPESVTVSKIEIQLYAPGSISVGHLMLSPDAVCVQTPPAIQTTTIPSFPDFDETTTTTTNPTVGDALCPGDVDGDGAVSTADIRLMLLYAIGSVGFNSDQFVLGDVNGDGEVTTVDAREFLLMLLQ